MLALVLCPGILCRSSGIEATITIVPQGLSKTELMGELADLLGLPAYQAVEPENLVRLLAACPDDKALNAFLSRNLEEPFEQRAANLPAAEVRLHIDVLDLDIRLLRRDDLHRCAALDGAVDIADSRPSWSATRK
jgi:hypothetical protein